MAKTRAGHLVIEHLDDQHTPLGRGAHRRLVLPGVMRMWLPTGLPRPGGRAAIRLARRISWGRVLMSALGLVLALMVARASWHLPLLLDAEHALFDARLAVTAPRVAQDQRIVIVPYTDETLIASGKRSPLDRTILAKALARLDTMGARAIGIDILIDQLQSDDQRLVAAFRHLRTPTFLAHASTATASEEILYRQQQFLDSFQKIIGTTRVHPASIVLQTDSDDIMRRWPAIVPGAPPRLANAMNPGASGFDGYRGSIAYRRPALKDQPLFPTIPIDTVADDAIFAQPGAAALFAQQISGRYVLIGGNIEGIDLFRSPLGRVAAKGEPRTVWGVELFAHMLAQMLDGRLLHPLPSLQLWAIAAMVMIAGGLSGAFNVTPLASAGLVAGQLLGFAALPFWLAMHGVDTYDLPAFGWIVGWLLAFLSVGAAARALTSQQRRFAQGALGKYLPHDVAAEIMKNPDALRLHGEKREIFIVFSDLEGFTKLSHAIEPEMVAFLLNRYLDKLSEVVLRHGGTIDKFVGNAVVAFWGAPISRPDDGKRCVEAAIAMHQAGEAFRAEAPEGVPPIGMTRVGVHFGEAIVGNFGGEGRIQYTALGDAMNTAARLESANKQTKSGVLVSEAAASRSGVDCFRPLGFVVLRGRASAIEIFEPVPQMADAERRDFSEVANRAARGEPAAVAEIAARAARNSADQALAQFAYRVANQEPGGHYVLD